MPFRVSILDFGMVEPGTSPAASLRELMQTAPLLEELGYHRLWLAEHHEKHFCYAAPEVLVPHLASVTSTLRIGVAGILMHFHTPLKVAEVFRSLTALYGDRIDLGLASGLAGDPQIQEALRPGFDLKNALETRLYTRQVEELYALFQNEVRFGNELYAGPLPLDAPTPRIILLGGGAGRGNMMLAAQHGSEFCYSLAHGRTDSGVQSVTAYREQFQGKTPESKPHTMIAANILCADSSLQAFGMLGRMLEHAPGLRSNIVGDPNHCRNRILGLLQKYGCNEIVLMPLYARLDQKLAAYKVLADVLELNSGCRTKTETETLQLV